MIYQPKLLPYLWQIQQCYLAYEYTVLLSGLIITNRILQRCMLSDRSVSLSLFSCWFSESRALGTYRKKLQELIEIQTMDKDLDLCCRRKHNALSRKQSRLQGWVSSKRGAIVRSPPLNLEIRNSFKNRTIEMHLVRVELRVSFCQNVTASPWVKSGCIHV